MSSIQMRRKLCREATGPTEAEFAAEGATFLVGMIRPVSPRHMARYQMITPVDHWFYPYEYIDTLPVLVGEAVGSLFGGGGQSPEARMQKASARSAARASRRASRQENRTGLAARELIGWFERQGGEVESLWSAPGDGAGFIFVAEDEFTLRAVQSKARGIAKDPRFNSYVAVVPAEVEGEFLVAFVREPRLVPLDFDTAVALADASLDPESVNEAIQISKPAPGEILAEPLPPAGSGALFGGKLRDVFGPKKPEKIQKKIDNLEEQLAYWKGKLAEAGDKSEKSSGIVIGNLYSMPGRFARAEDQRYADAYSPSMFADAADDMDYSPDDPDMFRDAEDGSYDYGAELEASGLSRSELISKVTSKYRQMAAAGQITPDQLEHLIHIANNYMTDEQLMAELDEEVGFAGRMSGPVGVRPISSSSSRSGRGGRRRRKARRRRKQRQKRKSRKGGGSGGSQQAQQPQIIIIREGGGGDDYEEGDDYEDDYESDGFGMGDSALSYGRVFDLPYSPGGAVIDYPVG